MRFYNVDMRGKNFLQAQTPGAAVAADERRILYDSPEVKYSDGTDWYKFWTEKNTADLAAAIASDPSSIAQLATVFLRKDQNDASLFQITMAGLVVTGATATVNGGTVWTSVNDGPGSGLDADLLDSQDSAFYRSASNLNAGTVPVARLSGTYNISITGSARYA